MDDSKPIGEIVDEALVRILGPAGSEFHAELARQTAENRERIERDARARLEDVVAEVYGELTGTDAPPGRLERAARTEAERRIRAEVGRRIAEEEMNFRGRVDRLYAWTRSGRTPAEEGPSD